MLGNYMYVSRKRHQAEFCVPFYFTLDMQLLSIELGKANIADTFATMDKTLTADIMSEIWIEKFHTLLLCSLRQSGSPVVSSVTDST